MWAPERRERVFYRQVLPEEGINHPSEGVSSLALEGPSQSCGTPSAGVIMKVVCT